MKIVHVVDSMEVGGAETLVLQMCRAQREQGHFPSVCAIAARGALGEQMEAEGFSVQANVGKHLTDSVLNFYRIFRSLKPDVVHLHNPTPTIYASAAARLAGVRSVISTRHSLVAPPHNWTMERKYAIAAKFCNWIVGICDATTNNIRNLGTVPDRKITRVYNGALPIERNSSHPSPSKAGFTLLYVGRLEPVKNHELLLKAFASALESDSSLHLWFVGGGSQREGLESLSAELGIAKKVTFWGQQLDVSPFFSAADAFIMSSVSEGLPMSLLQAFSLGLPAIVTDVGGMAEVVRLAQGGLVVPSNDAEQMTAGMLKMASQPEKRRALSENAEAAFRSHFSLASMLEAYMKLYTTKP